MNERLFISCDTTMRRPDSRDIWDNTMRRVSRVIRSNTLLPSICHQNIRWFLTLSIVKRWKQNQPARGSFNILIYVKYDENILYRIMQLLQKVLLFENPTFPVKCNLNEKNRYQINHPTWDFNINTYFYSRLID